MTSIHFVVPGSQVSTNQSYRAGKGRFWMSVEGREFKSLIGLFARKAMRGTKPLICDVSVTIDFFYPSARNDIDGPVKLVLDSLQPDVLLNDRQVVELAIRKYVDRDNPRTSVVVTPKEICLDPKLDQTKH